MHASLGRSGKTTTGCLRPGVTTWIVREAVLSEILEADAVRVLNEETVFELLQVTPR